MDQSPNVLKEATKILKRTLEAHYRAISRFNREQKEIRQERKRLCDQIVSWWNNGQCDGPLDLSSFRGEAIRDLPAAVTDITQHKIVELTLPASLNDDVNQIPDWLSRLTNLGDLTLPNYQGSASTLNVLQTWVSGDNKSVLDLSALNGSDIQSISPALLRILRPHITDLILPKSLNDGNNPVPPWFASFTKLKQLSLPNYEGEKLDLRRLKTEDFCTIEVGGDVIREVFGPSKSRVYSRDAGKTTYVVVKLFDDNDAVVVTTSGYGYGHFRGDGGILDRWNPNSQAEFENGTKIACRHLAVMSAIIDQRHKNGLPLAAELMPEDALEIEPGTTRIAPSDRMSRQCAVLGDLKFVKKNVEPITETICKELLRHAPVNAFVGRGEWGDALADMGASVEADGDAVPVIIFYSRHFMYLPVVCVNLANGDRQYIAALTDPNTQLVEIAFPVHSLDELRKATIETFLERSKIDFYYGIQERDGKTEMPKYRVETSHFMLAPPNLYKRVHSEEPLFNGQEKRTVREFLSDSDQTDPGIAHYWLVSDLPLTMNDMRQKLAKCPNDAERLRFLSAKLKDGTPGRNLAFQNGCLNAFEIHGELLLEEHLNGRITKSEFTELHFAESSDGTPGRNRAMHNGNTPIVRADNKFLKRLLQSKLIDKTTFTKRVLAMLANGGATARCMGAEHNHFETLYADNEIILDAVKDKHLDAADPELFELAEAKSKDGFTTRMMAGQEDHSDVLRADNQLLENLPLADIQFSKLLTAEIPGSGGSPVRFLATQRKQFKFLSVDDELLFALRKTERIKQSTFNDLLAARRKQDGLPIRGLGLGSGDEGIVDLDNHTLFHAKSQGCLENDDLYGLIKACLADGTPARFFALLSNHTAAIQADNRLILEARRRDWLSNQQLVDLLSPKHFTNAPGFTVQPGNTNLEACKEHGRAILESYSEGWITKEELDAMEPLDRWWRRNLLTEVLAADTKLLLRQALASPGITDTSAADHGASKQQPSERTEQLLNDVVGVIDNVTKLYQFNSGFPINPQIQIQLRQAMLGIQNAVKKLQTGDDDPRERNECLHAIKRSIDEVKRVTNIQTQQGGIPGQRQQQRPPGISPADGMRGR